ncbi:ATP-binding protein [Kitasatospora sp. GP82]|uniref:ATP-binding protein n=1 Tax=Kitasatospora sp. GP82 TaxID=3035089 RepID=UPI0024759F46|nr:ATP-binding protein [Kitasatospora sp. GP82]MDH6129410.1 putative kinase [Kitasatospora sp. GP82]
MPLSVPLVLRPGYPDRYFTVHVHRVRWSVPNVSPVLTPDHLAQLEDNARRGLRMVSECVAAELTDADIEVTEHPTGGADAVARVLCDSDVCAAVAEQYRRDADEDVEAEAARAWAATQLQGQTMELLRPLGKVEQDHAPAVAATRQVLAALGLPEICLVVLIGASGSGKSTLAGLFPAGSVLNADRLREALTGDPLDQSVSTTAWDLLHRRLDRMLSEHRSAVVDGVNSEAWARKKLIAAGHLHGMPVVALVVDATLEQALARNAARPAALRVRDQVVTAQHAELTRDLSGLLAEGFTAVHHSRDLPVMDVLLRACAEQEKTNPALHVERAFGRDLARLFTRRDGESNNGLGNGTFAIGGQELTIRWVEQDDPDQIVHQMKIACPDCGGPAWVGVYCATDLMDARAGSYPVQSTCLCP